MCSGVSRSTIVPRSAIIPSTIKSMYTAGVLYPKRKVRAIKLVIIIKIKSITSKVQGKSSKKRLIPCPANPIRDILPLALMSNIIKLRRKIETSKTAAIKTINRAKRSRK